MRWRYSLTCGLLALSVLTSCLFESSPVSSPISLDDSLPTATSEVRGAVTPSGSDAPVTIMFAAWDRERAIYAPLIERFHQEHAESRIQFVSLDRLYEEALANRNAPHDPDTILQHVLGGADTLVVNPTTAAIVRGWVRDLRPLMDADASFNPSDFYPAARGLIDQSGGLSIVPRNLDVQLLSYNKALWADAGLPTPTLDWRWRDLTAAAEQLTKKQGNTISVHGLAAWNTPLTAWKVEIADAGIDLAATPLERLRLDQPAVEQALKHVVALTKAGVLYVGNSPDDDRQAIISQRVAIWPTETPFFGHPDTTLPFERGTILFPTVPIQVEGYVISSGTQHPTEAWRWLAFLSQQAITWTLGDSNVTTQVPARPSIAERSGFWSRLDPETVAALKSALDRPLAALPVEIDERVEDLLGQAMQAVLQGDKPIVQALRDAQVGLEQLAQQPTAQPGSGVITVATPVPPAPAGSVTIRFGAPGFSLAPLRQLVRAFTRANPTIAVELYDTSVATSTADLGGAAARADCFVAFGSPTQATIPSLLDIQPLIDADPDFSLADYPPIVLTQNKSEPVATGF